MSGFGIIGAGRMGTLHAGHLAAINGAVIAGVYDVDKAAAEKINCAHAAAIYDSAEVLAGAAGVDCLVIASPTYCHLEAIRAAVKSDKAIFCEKPLARTFADAREALGLLRNHSRLFTIGFVRRHMAKSLKVKQLLEQGLLGRIRYCNVDLPFGSYSRMYGDWFTDFDKSGGVLIDMLAHHVDLANWFFGEPLSVYAASLLLDPSQELPADYASATIIYKNGVICNLMCAWQRFGRSNEQMEICGEKGALIMDGSDTLIYYPAQGGSENIDLSPADEDAGGVEQVNVGDGYKIQMERLAAALKTGIASTMPTEQDGFRSLEIGLAMIESAKSNQVIYLPSENN